MQALHLLIPAPFAHWFLEYSLRASGLLQPAQFLMPAVSAEMAVALLRCVCSPSITSWAKDEASWANDEAFAAAAARVDPAAARNEDANGAAFWSEDVRDDTGSSVL